MACIHIWTRTQRRDTGGGGRGGHHAGELGEGQGDLSSANALGTYGPLNHPTTKSLQLQEMGFDREQAVQAYLLAGKDENMAVNLLLGG